MYRTLFLALSMAWIASVSKAHEFWIDPVAHMVAPGEMVEANIRVGEAYEGPAYSYVPRNFQRFEFAFGGEVAEVPGTVGDRPAFKLAPEGEGLLVIVHQTSDQRLIWSTWEKFVKFLTHKDLTWGLAEHDARGISRERVRERYSRYAKSLVAVGDGAGSDIEAGLLIEIVALENPYTDDMSDGLNFRAAFEGNPLAETQIEVFEKAPGGAVEITTLRTDSQGQATVPVRPGHRYMLDAVVLRPLEPEAETDPVWETLWANLTFEVPMP